MHHCPGVDGLSSAVDSNINIGSCPKLGATCGPDCAVIDNTYGIGPIPPFGECEVGTKVTFSYNSNKFITSLRIPLPQLLLPL